MFGGLPLRRTRSPHAFYVFLIRHFLNLSKDGVEERCGIYRSPAIGEGEDHCIVDPVH